MTDTNDPATLVRELFEAWSSEDPEAVAARFHEDATFFDSVNGQFHGREAIKQFYAGSLDAWAELRTRPVRIWVDGDTAACTWTMTGRMREERFGPELGGREARIDGMAWVRFQDGLIVHDEEYFDRQAPMASLEGKGFAVEPETSQA